MIRSNPLVAVFTSLALVAGSTVVLADPGSNNGKGNSQKAQAHGGPAKSQGSDRSEWSHGPSVDRGSVLGVLSSYRDYWSPGVALPPGIQKNLARGKPLPPGIAKKLDGRLLGHLPHYEGYEWQQAGVDLILVAIATGIIYEVLSGALD